MEPEAAGTLRLMIWNINSLVPTVRNFILKYGSFRGFFEEHSVQIACLQETKMLDDKLTKDLVCLEGYESFWATSREKKGYSGVTTYASTAYSPVKAEADCLGDGESDLDREGRVVLTDHMAFVLVNVYAPNAGERPERPRKDFKCRFLTALKAKCDSLRAKGREVLIVGDLNVAASQRDVHPKFSYEALYSEEENQAMHALLGEYTDVWRHRHPQDTSTYTVWDEKTSARAFNEGLRIDYALCTPGLLAKVVSCEVVQTPPKWSDHAAMVLELRDISPIAAHAPCALSSSRMKRFNDRGQPSVATMFGRKPASKRAAGLEAEQVPGASRKVSKQEGASAAAPESRTRPSATAPGQLDQPRLSAAKTTAPEEQQFQRATQPAQGLIWQP
ncbi:hypothetical protein WJX72_003899 [[Myrmecia] bisecta]|uniref:DNA-(apurinic or apyrimidinic site) endonuclease n=1 Tax=[Myrmecia] bisecta TaxID=41462 RepID=A0AAW1QET8_9CHLO